MPSLRGLFCTLQAVEIHSQIFKPGSMFIFKFETGYCGSRSRYDEMGPAQEREWPELRDGEEQIHQMTKDVGSTGICHQLDYGEHPGI